MWCSAWGSGLDLRLNGLKSAIKIQQAMFVIDKSSPIFQFLPAGCFEWHGSLMSVSGIGCRLLLINWLLLIG
jgi:uncharacterized membrane protein